jgi:hypothetical protein
VLADVPHRRGTQQGVGYRVEQGVGIAVALQGLMMRNPASAELEMVALGESVGIMTDPDAKGKGGTQRKTSLSNEKSERKNGKRRDYRPKRRSRQTMTPGL